MTTSTARGIPFGLGMIALLVVLVGSILAVSVLAGDRKLVQFRLKKDPGARVKVYCLEANDDGMQLEAIGSHKKSFVSWDDIVESDAKRLRIDYKLELTDDEKQGLIPGQEIFFRGGASIRGILERKDEKNNQIIVRTDGMILPYPLDRVDRVEQIKIQEGEAYTEEEIYITRLEKRPPTNWGNASRARAK